MSSTQSLAEELGAMSATYETSDTVQNILKSKELVPLIGPFAVGKTTLMRTVESFNSAFGRVRSFTTRTQRVGEEDTTYDFLPHDVETLSRIRDQALARELVQLIVHPKTGFVYGSTVESYHADYPMLDVMPTSLPGLEKLPFQQVRRTFVIAPPAAWKRRAQERLQDGDPDDLRKRLNEGVASLTWALDQGDDLAWVINGDTGVREVAVNLIRIVRYGDERLAVNAARNTANRLLDEMRTLAAA